MALGIMVWMFIAGWILGGLAFTYFGLRGAIEAYRDYTGTRVLMGMGLMAFGLAFVGFGIFLGLHS